MIDHERCHKTLISKLPTPFLFDLNLACVFIFGKERKKTQEHLSGIQDKLIAGLRLHHGSDTFKTRGGGTLIANIRGGAAGKSEKLPCPRVRFLKMIPCPAAKVLKQYPVLEFLQTKL